METDNNTNLGAPNVTVGDVIPKVGQEFGTIDDAYNFYNYYARSVGFGIRIGNSKKDKETKEVAWKLFVCSKEGKTNEEYQQNVKHSVPRTGERNRGHTRCGCKARLSLVKNQSKSKWVVRQFTDEHNHVLLTPTKVPFLRSHRKVSATKKALTQQFIEANIPTCQQVRLMEIDSGGPSMYGCLERDIRNHERDVRQELSGHDAETLIEHFMLEKERNPNFYYAYETDENDVFRQCLWVDSGSRASYAYFGDAVVFDTTYNTNKYSLVFAPLVGVNNHRQTVVFACGLLSDEKIESFIWLFSKFIEAMPTHVPPQVIITDQDPAIARAISMVFPSSLHRFCIWHIMNKFSEKMSVILYRDHYHQLANIIADSETPNEFEDRWAKVMESTELGRNEWLRQMFEIRHRWVPAYVKHVFSAGMSSSQRVESNHSFFKRYVNKKNTLIDFMTRFGRALSNQRHEEVRLTQVDISERPRTITASMMEKHMSQIYTKSIFLMFQRELEQSNLYVCRKSSSSDGVKVYLVHMIEEGRNIDRVRQLTYNISSDFMSCSCMKFNFEGYPCRHMLSLMKKKQVMTLPDNYILGRWAQTAKLSPIFATTSSSLHGLSLISRHGMLVHLASDLVDNGALTEARFDFMTGEFQRLKLQVRDMDDRGLPSKVGVSHRGGDGNIVSDPLPVRTKGCGKRLKSSKEKAMAQNRRHCRVCNRGGHDKRTCPTSTPGLNLLEEPYVPQFSYDDQQDDIYGAAGSAEYDAFLGLDSGNYP